jgi:CDP-diacylglycerol--serine O-phosphatidyltransferase
LIYVLCVALRLARFNINSNQEPSWRDNFFEGVPSPAGGILVLTPLVISMTNFDLIKIDNNIIAPIFFIVTSLLLISKFPTYSFKKIVIQRQTTIFLLFGIVLFFGFILIYPFVAISISAILYLLMFPISYFHYNKLKKQNADKINTEDDDFEDIL